MRTHHRHPLALVALTACALLIAVEGWWWRDAALRARQACVELEQKRREWRTLATLSPAPAAKVAVQIEAALARRRQALADLETRPGGRGPLAETFPAEVTPAGRADEFFALTAFRERMQARAREGGIAVKSGEHFGFEEGRGAGAESRPAQAAVRERLAAEHLLGMLFASGPRELVALERKTAEGSEARAGSGTVFRVAFVGETRTLRGFLNGLTSADLPWRVRAVEVEPAAGASAPPRAIDGIAVPAPRVPRSWSRFVVTVELAGLAPAAGRG